MELKLIEYSRSSEGIQCPGFSVRGGVKNANIFTWAFYQCGILKGSNDTVPAERSGKENQKFIDNRYSRRHLLRFDGGLEIPGSSSPHVVPLPFSDPQPSIRKKPLSPRFPKLPHAMVSLDRGEKQVCGGSLPRCGDRNHGKKCSRQAPHLGRHVKARCTLSGSGARLLKNSGRCTMRRMMSVSSRTR